MKTETFFFVTFSVQLQHAKLLGHNNQISRHFYSFKNPNGWKFLACKGGHVNGNEDICNTTEDETKLEHDMTP